MKQLPRKVSKSRTWLFILVASVLTLVSSLHLQNVKALSIAPNVNNFAQAAPPKPKAGGNGGTTNPSTPCDPSTDGTCSQCASNNGVSNCVPCNQDGSGNNTNCGDNAVKCDQKNCDFIAKYINPGIALLSVCFGLIAIISIILGGINYITSEGDPQKTAKAKSRVFNTIFAIIAYLFLYTFLEFLIPGGIFN